MNYHHLNEYLEEVLMEPLNRMLEQIMNDRCDDHIQGKTLRMFQGLRAGFKVCKFKVALYNFKKPDKVLYVQQV